MSGARSEPPGNRSGKGWLRSRFTLGALPDPPSRDAGPRPPPPPVTTARLVATVLWIAVFCAIVAPIIGTVLLALRVNGLSFELVAAPVLAPMAVIYAGPAAFALGLVFGTMLVGLARLGWNHPALRVALAVGVATLAWALSAPLPAAPEGPTPGPAGAADTILPGLDWLVLAATAAATSLVITTGWLTRRIDSE